ncbi:MAG: thiamine-phosphate kinase [Victivallaceae bacterium]|nr:thiamine-phosphate kinase [Victivallaceae bacterium]
MMDELGLLAKILPMLPDRPDVAVPPGDDAAAVRIGGRLLLAASDQLASDVHFYLDGTPACEAGAKLLKRNLSDIAAMGGTPAWCLVNLACRGVTGQWITDFHRGICETARRFNVAVIGGDLCETATDGVAASLTILGTVEEEKLCLRKNVRPGDAIYATGTFGNSLASGSHLAFTPRLAEAEWLAGRFTDAMMDVSDGPALDLERMAAASNVAIIIDPEKLPPRDGADVDHRLGDGEDYELLFAVRPQLVQQLEAEWPFDTPLTAIGCAASGEPGLTDINGRKIKQHGYQHFKDL